MSLHTIITLWQAVFLLHTALCGRKIGEMNNVANTVGKHRICYGPPEKSDIRLSRTSIHFLCYMSVWIWYRLLSMIRQGIHLIRVMDWTQWWPVVWLCVIPVRPYQSFIQPCPRLSCMLSSKTHICHIKQNIPKSSYL